MKTFAILSVSCVLLAGCASAPAGSETAQGGAGGPAPGAAYDGGDGGYLVYAVGTIDGFGMRFSFPYERFETPEGGAVDDWKGEIRPSVGGAVYLKIKQPDFEGFETGHVVTRRLPPGRYAVTDFEFSGSGVGAIYEWSSAKPFRIEFSIGEGEATYIGSFMRSLPPKGVSGDVKAAGYFLVSDKVERDAPLAKGRLPEGMAIKSEVMDVDEFGSAVLRSKPIGAQ